MTTTFLSGVALAAMLAPSLAQASIEDIRNRDFNENGKIDRGEELDAVLAISESFGEFATVRLREFEIGSSAQIDISSLDPSSYAERLAESCERDNPFHLRDKLSSLSLTDPAVLTPSKGGASFSISRDYIIEESSWSASGVMTYVPRGFVDACVLRDQNDNPGGARVSAYAIAPFVEFSGSGTTSATGSSNLTFGAIAQIQLFGGGLFDLQEISFAPYYRTDFDGEADIYGAALLWKPYHFNSRLNGLQGDRTTNGFDWSLIGEVDYLSVDVAGNSGLTSDDERAWIGGTLGVGYTWGDFGAYGLRLDANVSSYLDALEGDDVTLTTAIARLPLTKDGTAGLQLDYTYGEDKDQVSVDQAGLKLTVTF